MILLDIDYIEDPIEKAKKTVSNIYNIDNPTLKCRKNAYVKARQMLIYDFYWNKNISTLKIGKILNLDHSTVMYHRDKFFDEIAIYEDTFKEYQNYMGIIYGTTNETSN